MDDAELTRGLRLKDPLAMDRLVTEYHADLYRFLRHLTRHQQDAEDLTQQTLLRAIQRADRYVPLASFRSWLYGIAYREFLSWRRRRFWLPLVADRIDPLNRFSTIADTEILLAALARLPSATRAAFLMHYVEDLSIADVALSLGIPEGTVKSRLHSARSRLRDLLQEESYVPEVC